MAIWPFSSVVSLYAAHLRRTFLSGGLHRRHTTINTTQTTLHYWISNPTPSTPTLLLLHGLGPDSTWQWSHQAFPLSRHFRLVIPDLLFFGDSTTSSPDRTDLFQAECVLALLDELGVEKFSVVGTSYGGFVAYHIGRMAGERVEKVVVASSDLMKEGGSDPRLMKMAGVEKIEELMLPETAEMVRKLIGVVFYDRLMAWLLPDFLLWDVIKKQYTKNREEKVQLMKNITVEKSDGLEKLLQDVLIVWGEHDNIFPLEKAYMVKKHLGEKATLEVIENTGHMPQAEDPKRFNNIVLNFLLRDGSSL